MVLVTLAGCQKLRPEQVSIPEYPDLNAFYKDQVKRLGSSSVEKSVSLDDQKETQLLEMDSVGWAEELSFIREMNPNQPEYVGAFKSNTSESRWSLQLKEGESGILKKLVFYPNKKQPSNISATIHEDKDVYVHHREVSISLENDKIISFVLEGYQKMMFKDTVRFSIHAEVRP